jgi:hypothetical protein
MLYTLQQYETLKAAIAQGALRVEYSDKKVEYRSLKDMKQILRDMETELGLNANNNGGRKFAAFNKGINNGCTDNERWIS